MRGAVIENPLRIPQELNSNLFESRKDEHNRRGTKSIDRKCEEKQQRETSARSKKIDLTHETKTSQHFMQVRSSEASYKTNGILCHNLDGRMSTYDFVTKRREMLLLNMKINTQHEQIENLHRQLNDRENALKAKEATLEESIERLDTFLKDVDDKAKNTELTAEREYAKRVKKEEELAAIRHQFETIQSDIAKHTVALDEHLQCKQFLDSLTPPSWFDDCLADKRKRQQQRRRDRINARKAAFLNQKKEEQTVENTSSLSKRSSRKPVVEHKSQTAPDFEDEPLTSSDEEYPMYFQSPHQLLDRFSDMEREILFHTKEVNEREATLRELKEQIKAITNAHEFEAKKCYESQNVQSTLQTKLENDKASLEMKIEELYKACGLGITSEASQDLPFMVSEIESFAEHLISKVENMPSDWVAKQLEEKRTATEV
ncbi:hypothetical protein ACHAWX_000873 [Stephanocyclus meneghinianus]